MSCGRLKFLYFTYFGRNEIIIIQGVNKHNGETVAVKTFNQLSHMRPQEVQMREFEVNHSYLHTSASISIFCNLINCFQVLEKVKHENIVKLLAIEEEQEGRGKGMGEEDTALLRRSARHPHCVEVTLVSSPSSSSAPSVGKPLAEPIVIP